MEKPGQTASLKRLPAYLAYLQIHRKQGVRHISSTRIAEDMRMNPVQVRKDLAAASSAGRPKLGFPVDTLIGDIEKLLGFQSPKDAFLVGAGHLGRALLRCAQFEEYGLSVLAAFDTDEGIIGTEIEGRPTFPLAKLPDLARRMGVRIGILAVPETAAQAACDCLVQGGIRAIWSFAVTPLKVPDGVIIKTENLAASLAALSLEVRGTLETSPPGPSPGEDGLPYCHVP